VQAVKAGKFEDRYENALVELLNQGAQARAGTNGRETARYRQRRQPDAGKSLNDVGNGGASQPAKVIRRRSGIGSRNADGDFRQGSKGEILARSRCFPLCLR
jgi:hypothetical protein